MCQQFFNKSVSPGMRNCRLKLIDPVEDSVFQEISFIVFAWVISWVISTVCIRIKGLKAFNSGCRWSIVDSFYRKRGEIIVLPMSDACSVLLFSV
ncbi:hypothetical protein HNQ69_001094 [Bartonella callosciuri]|uniref:Uncharacterized protein n=1 Tax=Bartonella callosciuri TaxID=686223 RepID=A0A840NSC1_9HYPH|nr:hypothetical protein [Bartonella callosciuri]MBB5073961.1 hypothetical protein [Bartonella callosciuri]